MVIKVLVSGAGGDVGQGVLKALQSSSLALELHATCINAHSSWLHAAGVKGFIAPPSAEAGYVDYLIRLIQRLGIHAYFPTVDSEIVKIATEKSRIESETGAVVFVDSLEKVSVCDDKFRTAEFLRCNDFAFPVSMLADDPKLGQFIDRLGYPLIVKMRSGKGSQHVHRLNDAAQLSHYLGNSDFVVQEWLNPDLGEYTSGIYLGDDGEVKGACTFRRQLKHGSTFIAERIVEPLLEKPLEEMARALGMKYLNIQSMRRGDKLVPFEFNGRLSGSTAMVARVFNAPELFLRERILGQHLDRVENKDLFVAMRYYEEVYARVEDIADLKQRSAQV